MNLHPYQEHGVAWLAGQQRALLADEPGLGKTAQVAVAARKLLGVGGLVVVICPASLRTNWQREWRRWNLGRQELQVFSYEQAHKAPRGCHILVADEAHYLKNRTAKRTRVFYEELMPHAKTVWLLSGTPAPNNASELWTHFHYLWPQRIDNMSWFKFVQTYCNWSMGDYGVKIHGTKNPAAIREMLRPVMLRRLKKDVLQELPPISFHDLPLEVSATAALLKEADHIADSKRLALALDKGELESLAPAMSSLRRVTGLAKVPAIVEWIENNVGDGKLVVFAHHRDVLDGIRVHLRDRGTGAVTLRGDTSAEERQRAVDSFQSDPGIRVFLGQIQAAGTGLTLTAASRVLFAEASWVPAENSQAAMRCHRIGQTEPVQVYFASLAGSIDEAVMEVVRRKTEDISQIVTV